MPTAYPESIGQRGYVQKEAAYGTINNAAGVASLANADAFLFMELEMNDAVEVSQRPDKTGDYSQLAGTPGRRNGTWRMKCALPGVSSVGSAPDIGPFFEAALGKETLHAGTDANYTADDVNTSLTIWDFNATSTGEQRAAVGCIVQKLTVTWGETYAYVEASGECHHVLTSGRFTGASTTEKAGLSAFPSEPASPAVTGDANPGYMGVITWDGTAYSTVRSGTLDMSFGRALQKNAWNETFPSRAMGGARSIGLTLALDDDDSAALIATKNKAYTGDKATASVQVGSVAKNIFLVALKEIVVPVPTYDYGQQLRGVTFSGMKSCQSALRARDEVDVKFR